MGRKRQAAPARKAKQEPSAAANAGRHVVAEPGRVLAGRIHAALGFLLLSPALLPLAFIPGFLFPYASPKTIAFRALGILVLSALTWLLLARVPLHFGRLRQRTTWIPAALLCVAWLASISGVAFYHSFWSTFERGDGLLTLTAEILFFYAILLYADAQFLRRLAILCMWVSGVVALYALVQWTHVSMQMPIPALMRTDERIGATFGNAAFMASYLGMSFLLTLWIARGCQGGRRIFVCIIAAIQLCAILVSGTRGTILALMLAGMVAAAYVAWHGNGGARLAARTFLAGCVGALLLFIAFREQLAQVPIATVQRLAAISPSSGTPAVRLVLWESIGREALRHPVAGVGAEHVEYVYNRAYSPDLISGQWNDHSHNVYLDYFVQFGFAGLFLYLALIVVALRTARAQQKAGESAGGYLVLFFLIYAAQNFFVFDIALTLWLFLAVLAFVLADMNSVPRQLALPAVHTAVPSLVAAAILLLLIPVTIQPVRANVLMAKAVSHDIADPEQEVRDITRGLALGTYADLEYGYGVYNMYAFTQQETLVGMARVTAHQAAQGVLAQNLVRYPYDVRTALYLAHIVDQTPPEIAPDVALLNRATAGVLKVSPRRPAAWYYRANVEIRQGDAAADDAEKRLRYTNAIAILKQYAALQPRIATPRYAIANLHLMMGDRVQAQEWAATADAVYRWNFDAASAAAGFYISAGDWAKAARFLGEVAGNDMTDYPVVLDLARARLLSGDRIGARALVDYLRKASPATLATDPELVARIEGQ